MDENIKRLIVDLLRIGNECTNLASNLMRETVTTEADREAVRHDLKKIYYNLQDTATDYGVFASPDKPR